MRIAALLSLVFGLLGLMLLDGQVFTHAVMGIICGGVAIGGGLASTRKDRSNTKNRWVGRTLAGLGLLLTLFSVARLPGAYKFQTKFNKRSPGQPDRQENSNGNVR